MAPKPIKVSRNRGSKSLLISLVVIVALLAAAVGYLVFGSPLFDTEPKSATERDYQVLMAALRTHPDDPAVLMTLAEKEYDLGRKVEALEHAAKAADVETPTAGIPVRYAQLLMLENQLKKAEEFALVEIGLDKDRKSAGPRWILAQIQFAQGREDDALKSMAEGLAIDPMAADARILYADMLVKTGDDKSAVREYRTALKFVPDDPRAIEGLRGLGVKYEATSTADPHSSGATTPQP